MPYPNYTRRERIPFFMSWLIKILWVMINLAFLYGVMATALAFGIFGWIPGWLASPLVIFGWAQANYRFWEYQAWRAGGPRGRIINPFGPNGTDMRTAILWLSFGVFFHFYHVWSRSGLAHKLRTQKA